MTVPCSPDVRAAGAGRPLASRGGRPAFGHAGALALIRRRSRAGASLRAIAAELEAAGLAAPAGGTRWHPMAVARILERESRYNAV